jgi:hypothetical protein
MVIETFRHGPQPVYERVGERGRLLPAGLTCLDSWIDERSMDRCFQVMETEDPGLLAEWTTRWADLVQFEIIPVIDSTEAAARARPGNRG